MCNCTSHIGIKKVPDPSYSGGGLVSQISITRTSVILSTIKEIMKLHESTHFLFSSFFSLSEFVFAVEQQLFINGHTMCHVFPPC